MSRRSTVERSSIVRNRRLSVVAGVIASLAQLLPTSVSSVIAAEPVDVVFSVSADEQTFDVPAGVTTVHVVLVGGRGGSNGTATAGGRGARVEGDLVVSSGDRLYIDVGFRGADVSLQPNPGGLNGGGAGGTCGADVPGTFRGASGGGASDIRSVPRNQAGSLESRLAVAAGGGGAGDLGNGGNAGQPGDGAISGSAGSGNAGGAGGSAFDLPVVPGQAGSFGLGGAGASSVACGAGGGGGWYGGGGGGADAADVTLGGAGGGGSNFLGFLTNAIVGFGTVDTTGGSVTISYLPAGDSGTVSAQVTVPTSAACLELSTAAVDFGTLPLGAEDQPGTPAVTVTNCSGLTETVLARATDATSAGATWALDDSAATCAGTLGTDKFHLDLRESATTVRLSTTNKQLETLGSGSAVDHTARISTACPGSSGAGATMTMQIVFVATE
jgi:hypothetical protein